MNEKNEKLLKRLVRTGETTLSLLVVFLLVASTAVMSGRLFGKDFAKQANGQAATGGLPLPGNALQELGLTGHSLEKEDSVLWKVSSADGKEAGVVVDTRPIAADIDGFAGPTPLWVYIDGAGIVRAVAAQENAETPDFFRRASEGCWPAGTGCRSGKPGNWTWMQ